MIEELENQLNDTCVARFLNVIAELEKLRDDYEQMECTSVEYDAIYGNVKTMLNAYNNVN